MTRRMAARARARRANCRLKNVGARKARSDSAATRMEFQRSAGKSLFGFVPSPDRAQAVPTTLFFFLFCFLLYARLAYS